MLSWWWCDAVSHSLCFNDFYLWCFKFSIISKCLTGAFSMTMPNTVTTNTSKTNLTFCDQEYKGTEAQNVSHHTCVRWTQGVVKSMQGSIVATCFWLLKKGRNTDPTGIIFQYSMLPKWRSLMFPNLRHKPDHELQYRAEMVWIMIWLGGISGLQFAKNMLPLNQALLSCYLDHITCSGVLALVHSTNTKQ